MALSYCFRVDAGGVYGFGHLRRCLVLADTVRDHRDHTAVRFVLAGGDAAAGALVEAAGYDYDVPPPGIGLADQAVHLCHEGWLVDVVVIDVTHAQTLSRADDAAALSAALGRLGLFRVLIDGVGDMTLVRSANFDVDMVVAPYPGALRFDGPTRFRHLTGYRYFVFAPELIHRAAAERNAIRETASRLLVTFGGSDPTSLSLKALRAIARCSPNALAVRVVVGPGFSAELRAAIDSAVRDARFEAETVVAPQGLVEHMMWCDLAIAATGLTKYELAMSGTPSIQLSVDAAHAAANAGFEALGTGLHLGVADAISEERLAEAVAELIADRAARRTMADLGPKCFDGLGARRIIDAVEKAAGAAR